MTLKNRTKRLFAQELQKMLTYQTIDEVRVVELCKRCDTIPQTFYYHFHDKYELVAWIFMDDFSAVYGNSVPEYTVSRLLASLNRMVQRRPFYRKVYTDHSQNAVTRCIQKFNVQNAVDAVTATWPGEPISTEMLTTIKYHAYGITGLLIEWLVGESPLTTEQLAHFQYDHTPAFLKTAYQAYEFKNADNFRIGL